MIRIVRRNLVGGSMDGRQVLVRDDIKKYRYEGCDYILVGENFVIKSPN